MEARPIGPDRRGSAALHAALRVTRRDCSPSPAPDTAVHRGTETVEETAQRYGIGRGMAYELARRGELPGVIRLGRRLVVAKAVTDRILGEGATE